MMTYVICSSGSRDESTICVVESPSDVMAIEDATGFKESILF